MKTFATTAVSLFAVLVAAAWYVIDSSPHSSIAVAPTHPQIQRPSPSMEVTIQKEIDANLPEQLTAAASNETPGTADRASIAAVDHSTSAIEFATVPETQVPRAIDSSDSSPAPARIPPADLRRLLARAVPAQVTSETIAEPTPEPAMKGQTEPAQDQSSPEPDPSADLNLLTESSRAKTPEERAADLLALLSDATDRSGLRPLLMEALRPGQPITLQRQALYLATDYNLGIVKAIAARPHPLQQDAEAFVLELQIEQGNVPPPVDQAD